jgi:replicative DNA helicase
MSGDYDDSLPVHDIEAERYCLAAMMNRPSEIGAAAEIMDSTAFFRPLHQDIFRVLVLMMVAGDKIDPVTVTSRMREEKLLKGNDLYIAELYALPVAGEAAFYAGVVLRHAVRRGVMELGSRMISHARAGDMDEALIVSRARDMLDQLMTGAGSHDEMPLLTADEFCDSGDINADPLVPGLLYRMERAVVVGPEGAGKSILGLQMAFTTAAGVHPFQHSMQFDPLKVCAMDLENPPHIVQRRFRTFRGIAQGYPGWDGKNLTLLHKPGGVNLTNARESYQVAQAIKRSGAQLVVAGPIYKMFQGMESSLETYARLAAFWDKMREDLGVTLWLEAHAPYGAGARREMRPEGSNIWAKWCEFGVSLNWATKKHGGRAGLDWRYFKGAREEGRPWPDWITRSRMPGRSWPWVANYDKAAFATPLIPADDENEPGWRDQGQDS